jgi:hypothetical protein
MQRGEVAASPQPLQRLWVPNSAGHSVSMSNTKAKVGKEGKRSWRKAG